MNCACRNLLELARCCASSCSVEWFLTCNHSVEPITNNKLKKSLTICGFRGIFTMFHDTIISKQTTLTVQVPTDGFSSRTSIQDTYGRRLGRAPPPYQAMTGSVTTSNPTRRRESGNRPRRSSGVLVPNMFQAIEVGHVTNLVLMNILPSAGSLPD